MGRPLKKKYFGGTGSGGEGVASLSFSNLGTGYFAANVAITLGAPDVPNGEQATVSSIALFGNGAINTYTITSGSGYTTAPSVSITGGNTTPAVATAVLSTSAADPVIRANAFVTSSLLTADIVKQVNDAAYKVTTTEGTAVCTLTDGTPDAAGEMSIRAVDAAAGTYWVTKLTAHRATLVPDTGTLYTAGQSAPWSFDAAVGATVQVESI